MSHRAEEPLPEGKRIRARVLNDRVALVLLLSCACILVLLFWFGAYSCSGEPTTTGVLRIAAVRPTKVVAEGEKAFQGPGSITAACDLISRGQFREAAQRIRQAEPSDSLWVRNLEEIVGRYEQVQQRRQAAKETAFKTRREELEKLKSSVDLAKLGDSAVDDPADPEMGRVADDPNEPNDLTDVLAAVARAVEFADEAQKGVLLSDPFVMKALQEAVNRSILLEAEGKWLNAYTNCYYWLQAIDENNTAYSDHADELLERASIAASFQDSPCESRDERYEGVEKYMFERAIEALNLHYVNSISYTQMATKAIKRCDLLAEVLAIAFADGLDADNGGSFEAPDPEKVTAWSVALAGLVDDMQSSAESFGKEQFLAILDKVLALNEATVQLPKQPLVGHFAEAALGSLDPYTVMVWPRQVQDFEKLMTNEFTGIGIEISKPKGLLTVSSLLPDTPAYRSGLDAGDVIEAVDGVPTKDMSLICAVKKITGPQGTKVTLAIRRPGEEQARDLTITRDRIIVPTLRGWQRTDDGQWLYMLDEKNRIGYVRVTSFSGETAYDLETILDRLESDGLRGLILDLRFNTGGLLDSAVEVVDKFVSEGLIVRTQPKSNMIPDFWYAHRRRTHPQYPLAILINSGSASASEIVAGALADNKHERAVLVGTRTHGKGSVQGITHYPGGGAELKYTMAYYYLPSDQRVKSREEVEKEGKTDWGVGPDVEVELTSEELRTMLDVQRDNDVLVQARRDESRTSFDKHVLSETLEADPQLAVALLVVQAKVINAAALAAAN